MKEESTGQRTRELRNWFASLPHSQYVKPGTVKTHANPSGSPDVCMILLAAFDHIHHLEARIQALESAGRVDKT